MRFDSLLDAIIQPTTQNSWIRESAVHGAAVHDIACADGADDIETPHAKIIDMQLSLVICC
jgi:hypothetical protein